MQIVDHSYIVARRWYLLTVDIANKCQAARRIICQTVGWGDFRRIVESISTINDSS